MERKPDKRVPQNNKLNLSQNCRRLSAHKRMLYISKSFLLNLKMQYKESTVHL